MKTIAKTEPEKVTIRLVTAIAYDGKADIKRRTLVYDRVKSMLHAVESNDEKDAPMGLKRIRATDLPKVGGLLGTSVAALTDAEAEKVLRGVLEARRKKAQSEVDSMKAALELLPEGT